MHNQITELHFKDKSCVGHMILSQIHIAYISVPLVGYLTAVKGVAQKCPQGQRSIEVTVCS